MGQQRQMVLIVLYCELSLLNMNSCSMLEVNVKNFSLLSMRSLYVFPSLLIMNCLGVMRFIMYFMKLLINIYRRSFLMIGNATASFLESTRGREGSKVAFFASSLEDKKEYRSGCIIDSEDL